MRCATAPRHCAAGAGCGAPARYAHAGGNPADGSGCAGCAEPCVRACEHAHCTARLAPRTKDNRTASATIARTPCIRSPRMQAHGHGRRILNTARMHAGCTSGCPHRHPAYDCDTRQPQHHYHHPHDRAAKSSCLVVERRIESAVQLNGSPVGGLVILVAGPLR